MRTASLAIVLLSLLLCPAVRAQEFVPAPTKISSDRVRVGDKLYWSHVVEPKQTLYSIGKAYGVSSLDIIDANPNLGLDSRSIRPGDVLLIPWHEIETSSPDTLALDPFLADSLAGTSTSRVSPKRSSEAAPKDSTTSRGVFKSLRDKLFPPKDTLSHTLDTLQVRDSIAVVPDNALLPVTVLADGAFEREVKIALLLPVDADSTANPRYMNFYFGALLAARQLARQGLAVELNVLDTKSEWDWNKAGRLLRRSDVVIGPVGSEDLLRALDYLGEGRYVVSPIDPRTESLTKTHPVVLAATPASVQVNDALDWLASDLNPGDSVLVVSEEGTALSQNAEQVLTRTATDTVFSNRSCYISYALAADIAVNEEYAPHAHQGSVTRVIAASDHDVFVGDVVRNAALQNYLKKKFVAYGPAKAKSSDTEQMCGALLHQSLSYYVDYDSDPVINFVSDYRALFKEDPDSFAFHGYDTFYYFALLASRYGTDWIEGLDKYTMEGLQADFRFPKGEDPGRVNAGIRRVVWSLPYNVTRHE